MDYLPQIFTSTDGYYQTIDPVSNDMMRNRILYMNGRVDDQSYCLLNSQMRYLASKSNRNIYLYINCQEGLSVNSALALFDVMNDLPCDVVTIGNGVAAGMAAFLLAAGTPGKRYITPSTEVMIKKQPLEGMNGQDPDSPVNAEHIQKVQTKVASVMARNCGRDISVITADLEYGCWFDAVQAVKYGIADYVGFPDFI